MRYQVPQFIEVEDKIFGPFTFKQFIYVAGGSGLCFILYRFLPLFIAIFLILPVAGLTLALAFYKVNNQPFIKMLEYAFSYVAGTKLYLWRKTAPKQQAAPAAQTGGALLSVPSLSKNKLSDLAWSLDVHEKVGTGGPGLGERELPHF